ncbi:hypothetical protein [Chloracidobacterium thermophilum]|uniref:hypothetical protein n=1 Tax=Chloracidobacterium thermophilum TaxID=458033 RepID=UPI002017D0CB|nr:hypothetical protein [Chloracidobacterium thermophilum]
MGLVGQVKGVVNAIAETELLRETEGETARLVRPPEALMRWTNALSKSFRISS